MATSETVAICAHMHVQLRRRTGRVTDTEWMASNAQYALEIVRFAREKALAEGHDDLLPLADRLEAEVPHMGRGERKPLIEQASDALRNAKVAEAARKHREQAEVETHRASGFLESTLGSVFGKHDGSDNGDAPRYVGGLR